MATKANTSTSETGKGKSKRSSNIAESKAEPEFTSGDFVWCKCVPLASFTDHFFLPIILQCSLTSVDRLTTCDSRSIGMVKTRNGLLK